MSDSKEIAKVTKNKVWYEPVTPIYEIQNAEKIAVLEDKKAKGFFSFLLFIVIICLAVWWFKAYILTTLNVIGIVLFFYSCYVAIQKYGINGNPFSAVFPIIMTAGMVIFYETFIGRHHADYKIVGQTAPIQIAQQEQQLTALLGQKKDWSNYVIKDYKLQNGVTFASIVKEMRAAGYKVTEDEIKVYNGITHLNEYAFNTLKIPTQPTPKTPVANNLKK